MTQTKPEKLKRDSGKCKEWERRRRDRLNEAFKGLTQLLPNYDPAKVISKIETLEQGTQFIKELRLSHSRLLGQATSSDETSKKLHELQDEVNKLILRVKQLTSLLQQAQIPIPLGPWIKSLGKRKLKWSGKIPSDPSESIPENFDPNTKSPLPESKRVRLDKQKDNSDDDGIDEGHAQVMVDGTPDKIDGQIQTSVDPLEPLKGNNKEVPKDDLQMGTSSNTAIEIEAPLLPLEPTILTAPNSIPSPTAPNLTPPTAPNLNPPTAPNLNPPKAPTLAQAQSSPHQKTSQIVLTSQSGIVTANLFNTSQNGTGNPTTIFLTNCLAQPILTRTLDLGPTHFVTNTQGQTLSKFVIPGSLSKIPIVRLTPAHPPKPKRTRRRRKKGGLEPLTTKCDAGTSTISLEEESESIMPLEIPTAEEPFSTENQRSTSPQIQGLSEESVVIEISDTNSTTKAQSGLEVISEAQTHDLAVPSKETKQMPEQVRNTEVEPESIQTSGEISPTKPAELEKGSGAQGPSSAVRMETEHQSNSGVRMETELQIINDPQTISDDSISQKPDTADKQTQEAKVRSIHLVTLEENTSTTAEGQTKSPCAPYPGSQVDPPEPHRTQTQPQPGRTLETVSDKISECIARSIDLVQDHEDPEEDNELLELTGTDWTGVVGGPGHDDPKSPISPTQFFLSSFPLLPRDGIIGLPPGSLLESHGQLTHHNNPPTSTTPKNSLRSFYIDDMLPDPLFSEHFLTGGHPTRGLLEASFPSSQKPLVTLTQTPTLSSSQRKEKTGSINRKDSSSGKAKGNLGLKVQSDKGPGPVRTHPKVSEEPFTYHPSTTYFHPQGLSLSDNLYSVDQLSTVSQEGQSSKHSSSMSRPKGSIYELDQGQVCPPDFFPGAYGGVVQNPFQSTTPTKKKSAQKSKSTKQSDVFCPAPNIFPVPVVSAQQTQIVLSEQKSPSKTRVVKGKGKPSGNLPDPIKSSASNSDGNSKSTGHRCQSSQPIPFSLATGNSPTLNKNIVPNINGIRPLESSKHTQGAGSKGHVIPSHGMPTVSFSNSFGNLMETHLSHHQSQNITNNSSSSNDNAYSMSYHHNEPVDSSGLNLHGQTQGPVPSNPQNSSPRPSPFYLPELSHIHGQSSHMESMPMFSSQPNNNNPQGFSSQNNTPGTTGQGQLYFSHQSENMVQTYSGRAISKTPSHSHSKNLGQTSQTQASANNNPLIPYPPASSTSSASTATNTTLGQRSPQYQAPTIRFSTVLPPPIPQTSSNKKQCHSLPAPYSWAPAVNWMTTDPPYSSCTNIIKNTNSPLMTPSRSTTRAINPFSTSGGQTSVHGTQTAKVHFPMTPTPDLPSYHQQHHHHQEYFHHGSPGRNILHQSSGQSQNHGSVSGSEPHSHYSSTDLLPFPTSSNHGGLMDQYQYQGHHHQGQTQPQLQTPPTSHLSFNNTYTSRGNHQGQPQNIQAQSNHHHHHNVQPSFPLELQSHQHPHHHSSSSSHHNHHHQGQGSISNFNLSSIFPEMNDKRILGPGGVHGGSSRLAPSSSSSNNFSVPSHGPQGIGSVMAQSIGSSVPVPDRANSTYYLSK